MKAKTLMLMACAISLNACADKKPVAYCPRPTIPSQYIENKLVITEKGKKYLNDVRKDLCKYYMVYDVKEFKYSNCDEILK